MGSGPLLDGIEKLALATTLIVINGFFVAAEIALVKLRHTQVEALKKKGSRGAIAAGRLKSRLSKVIGATQVGITLVSLLLGQYIEPLVDTAIAPTLASIGLGSSRWLHQLLFGIGFISMSFVLIVAGELVPKALALRRTEAVALWVARPLEAFQWIAHPLIRLIDSAADWVLDRLGVDTEAEEIGQSVDEIRLVLAGQKLPQGLELSQTIMLNSIDLRRRIVAEVMRPRREITFLDASKSFAECLATVEQSRFSRFPLCELGDPDQTVGVVHIKDLYPLRQRGRTAAILRSVARPLIFVPETTRLERLLQFFLERKLHLALVVDEYGSTTGMVTLEDVLEQLVGPIQDEFDHEKPKIIPSGDDQWDVDGTLPLFELEDITGQSVEMPGITTVGGWVAAFMGGFPRMGEVIPVGGFELMIEEIDGIRVSRLTLRRKPPVISDEEAQQPPSNNGPGPLTIRD